jgi:hypothetical protein
MTHEQQFQPHPRTVLEDAIRAMEGVAESGETYDSQVLLDHYNQATWAVDACQERRTPGFRSQRSGLIIKQALAMCAHEIAAAANDDAHAIGFASTASLTADMIEIEPQGRQLSRRAPRPATMTAAKTGAAKGQTAS